MRHYTKLAIAGVVLLLIFAAVGIAVATNGSDESADAQGTSTTSSQEVSDSSTSEVQQSTTTTVDPASVDEFLATWSDAENAAAFEVFQAEQARLDAEAAEAERQQQAAAEAERQQQAAQQPAPAPAPPAAAQYGSGACGGSLPPCYVMMRESGGNITAQNPTSSASGKWQFLDSTWQGYGGYAKASYAPESVQDAKAAALWAGGAGCSHWSAC